MVIPLELQLSTPDGFFACRSLTLTIGNTTVNDPLGQDAYGYFIFDQGDTAYLQVPSYSWIGIAPAEGGSGTALPLTDPGSTYDEGDQVGAVSISTVNLPFPFTYYGRTYTQASISANGFIAFGATTNSDWRNWRLPGPGGPNPMIAVFWDDLQLNAGSYVYTYYNSAQHYYVVEWYNVISGYDRVTPETFQAILYDPAYYPTLTGDGQIKLQYKQFNNIDLGSGAGRPHGNFASIGIKDHTGTIGLEYTFNNTYPVAARPLTHENALFITTRPVPMNSAYLTLGQSTIVDSGGDGQLDSGDTANVFLRLVNHGTEAATNVSATLISTDPYLSVTQASAAYGSVAASGSADPLTPFGVLVSSTCPNNHNASLTLNISSDQGSWTRYFTLPIYSPVLQFGTMIVSDPSGNNNGIVDPGETVSIIIPLINSGGGASTAGTASMTSPTGGITINTGTANFASIASGSQVNLTFNVTVSAAIPVGTLATVIFNAVAGTYNASRTDMIEVGAPLEIIIGTGTSTQSYPIDRYYNYSVHESIYLASEIGGNATLKSIGFYKASGTDTNPIEAVSIYMKHTSATTLASGNHSLDGYTLVYNGAFPNNATAGWMEVNLNPMFAYNNSQNLQVLIVKDFQQYINNYPQWRYTSSTTRARQNRSDSAMPTSLTATQNLPNINIKYFPVNDVLYPPQSLSASASHQSVRLNWAAPVTGSPTGYKIFRNGALLTTVTALTYLDTAVTNGTLYNYYLKAVYPAGESDVTPTVSATPAAIPPGNLTALAGHTIVDLNWTPASGRESAEGETDRAISGYRIYRNGSALTSITGTSYQDSGLTNGVSYAYYVTTLYTNPAGESSASNTVNATPIASPPTNLSALSGDSIVSLGWNGVTRDVVEGEFSLSDRTVSGYRVYRNGNPIATVTGTTYSDIGLTNGVTYSYYVTTVYTNPAGESGPSNTVNATPQQVLEVTVGTGTGFSANNTLSPINNTYKSIHGQSVYSASELNNLGVFGPINITGMGFNVGTAPNEALPNFRIRMKHTTASNSQAWHTAEELQTVYTAALYMPIAGDYNMLTFNTPFLWNGTDNILIDTAFGMLTNWTQSGTLQITVMTSGYRRTASDTIDQTNIFTGGSTGSFRPNIRLALQPIYVGPMISVDPAALAYGAVQTGTNDTRQFSIENTGDQVLTGSITTPAGYTVTQQARVHVSPITGTKEISETRNILNFSIPVGQSQVYNLNFAPTAVAAYNGNVVISSNAVNTATVNIAVTGSGFVPPTISVDEETLSIALRPGENSSETFNITNNGSQALNFSISLTPANPDWISISPLSGSLAGGQTQLITVLIEATELEPGTFEAAINIASNDPINPTIGVDATLEVENNEPILSLPASFELGMNGSLVVDFGLYCSDPDGDPLTLTCFGNSNVQIEMDDMSVTFSAVQDWIGTEMVTFSVTDGYASTPVTIPVNVMLEHLNVPTLMVSANAQGFLLQWNTVLHAGSYQIFRAADPQGPYGFIGATSGLSFQDNLTAAKAFYYVKAVNNPPAK
ncbi:MAG: choice-of-anchor D domain-containing protein, partial [Candidatus Cloacimonadaceae bacterium]|nr:choice-of-anchor D domain-containing protein [Candidatus Cloacimonadaceae bacterium]